MSLLHLALVGYMTLNGVDLAQTTSCISAQRCQEANRLMRPFANHPATLGAVKIGLDSAAVTGVLQMRKTHPKLAWGLTALGIAVEGFATVHNARYLAR